MIVAVLGKIIAVEPVENADRLELATVVCGKSGKWRGVVPRGVFDPGQMCEVYLPDAIVPHEPRFAFMEKRNWRVSQARFRGAPSECLIVELSNVVRMEVVTKDLNIGDSIEALVGASKYNKPIPPGFGDAYGAFPSFIPKTDETNVQSATDLLEKLQCEPYYITEKVDGTSATAYLHNGHFGCCSRNWELKPEGSFVWQMAHDNDLAAALASLPFAAAVQFEVYGPGIQSNPLGVSEKSIAIFNLYNIDEHEYCDLWELRNFCVRHNLPMVKIVEEGESFEHTLESLQELSGRDPYPNGAAREGIVVRAKREGHPDYARVSFKVINLEYKG